MSTRGRKPKPTALKLLQGNPGKRPLGEDVSLPVAEPEIPEYLDADAREEWHRIVPILKGMGVLTPADAIQLGLLCQAYAMLQKAQRALGKSGLLHKTSSGYIQQSPLIAIINNATATITRVANEFGLSPSARVRLSGSTGGKGRDKNNPWAEFGT